MSSPGSFTMVIGGNQFEVVRFGDGEPLNIKLQYCENFGGFGLS